MANYEQFEIIPIHGFDNTYRENLRPNHTRICNFIVLILLAISLGEFLVIILILNL